LEPGSPKERRRLMPEPMNRELTAEEEDQLWLEHHTCRRCGEVMDALAIRYGRPGVCSDCEYEVDLEEQRQLNSNSAGMKRA
jgi:hypothetical protein